MDISYYEKITKKGYNDGKDSYLTNKEYKNPYRYNSLEANLYRDNFDKGYEEGFENKSKIDEETSA